MAFILIIDTALEKGGVGIFKENNCIGSLENTHQNEHASFVQAAIEQLAKTHDVHLQDLDAVAVVNGPGSYTGLRVGLATAKGIAYALDKRLVAVDTLDALAYASMKEHGFADYYYIPMIDARRADVFCGVYGSNRQKIGEQAVWTLVPESCLPYASQKTTVINGSGYLKASGILKGDNILYSATTYSLADVNELAQEKYSKAEFLDVAYSEPHYLKAFYSTAKPKN